MTWDDPTKSGLCCAACVIDRKQAEAKGHTKAELPPLRPAVTILATPNIGPVSLLCYEHIQVQPVSPLTVPAPAGVLPGLRG